MAIAKFSIDFKITDDEISKFILEYEMENDPNTRASVTKILALQNLQMSLINRELTDKNFKCEISE